MKSKAVLKYIRSDLYRYTGKCAGKDIVRAYLTNSLFRFHVAFRCCKGEGFVRVLGKVLYTLNRSKKRIVLPPETQVGYGLYIGHGGPIVVHPSAVIGSNVNLSQFTTIGSNRGQAATIGDCTYIGPNVCIVENVRIGSNVTIGAGSVVTKDIPDNATAVGNYAKVIHYRDPGHFTRGNRWTDCEPPQQ